MKPEKIKSYTSIEFGGGIGARIALTKDNALIIQLCELESPTGNLGDKVKGCYDSIQVDLIFPTIESLEHFSSNVLQKALKQLRERIEETKKNN